MRRAIALSVYALACDHQAPPTIPAPPVPIPLIAAAPLDTITCGAARERMKTSFPPMQVRAAFADCYRPSCSPCPKDVTCSPCQMGWCTLTGDGPEDGACSLRIAGLSNACAGMTPGVVYVLRLEYSGGGYVAEACSQLAPRP